MSTRTIIENGAGRLLLDAQRDYVARAHWRGVAPRGEGYSPTWQTLRVCVAEGDTLAEVQAWAREQIASGAAFVRVYYTWPIRHGLPKAGKRDNFFVHMLRASQESAA